jgi:hypothetical protein
MEELRYIPHMKTLMVAVVLAGSLAGGALAQDFVAPKPSTPNVPLTKEPLQQRPSVGGIVAEIFNVKKPWQLLNPAAPKEYGDGRKMVSYSEKDPGKPKGFIVASVEW